MTDKEHLDRLNSIISKLAFNTNTLWFLDIIYKLDIKFVDSGVQTAGVTIKDFRPYLYINKGFVENLSDDEYKGLILHEMLHLALYHTTRANEDFNHEQWNVSCDLEVNSLIDSYKIKLPKGALFPKQFSMPDKLSSEMYYRDLKKNQKQNQQNQQNQQQSSSGQGSSSSGGGQGQGQNQQKNKGGKGNQNKSQTLDDHSGWAQDEATAQMQKQVLDKIIKEAVSKNQNDLNGTDTMEHIREGYSQANGCSKSDSQSQLTSGGKGHGSGKGSSVFDVDSSESGKVKWNYILNRLIRKTLSKSYLPSFKRISRRYGELVKGHIKNHVIDNLIIAVDTSGSIDKDLHKRFMEEIKLIKIMFKIKIRYIQCDSEIQQDMKFERYTDVNKIRIMGGGGTDFRPVFDLIDKNHYNPNAILYFTDGKGDYPKYSKYNTLWVLSDRECLNDPDYKPPFGNVLILEDAND